MFTYLNKNQCKRCKNIRDSLTEKVFLPLCKMVYYETLLLCLCYVLLLHLPGFLSLDWFVSIISCRQFDLDFQHFYYTRKYNRQFLATRWKFNYNLKHFKVICVILCFSYPILLKLRSSSSWFCNTQKFYNR